MMVAEYSDEEIEVILAHELAHHVHGDIWKGIVFESALMVGGFDLAVWSWRTSDNRPARLVDAAGLPLLLLAAVQSRC